MQIYLDCISWHSFKSIWCWLVDIEIFLHLQCFYWVEQLRFSVYYFPEYSIQALLSAPNPDDPLSDNIAKHWKADEAEAVETGNFIRFWCYFDVTEQVVTSLCLPIKEVYLIETFLNEILALIIQTEFLLDNAAKEWTRLYASGAWWRWDQHLGTITCLVAQSRRPCFSFKINGKCQSENNEHVKSFDAVIFYAVYQLSFELEDTSLYVSVVKFVIYPCLCCEISTYLGRSLICGKTTFSVLITKCASYLEFALRICLVFFCSSVVIELLENHLQYVSNMYCFAIYVGLVIDPRK